MLRRFTAAAVVVIATAACTTQEETAGDGPGLPEGDLVVVATGIGSQDVEAEAPGRVLVYQDGQQVMDVSTGDSASFQPVLREDGLLVMDRRTITRIHAAGVDHVEHTREGMASPQGGVVTGDGTMIGLLNSGIDPDTQTYVTNVVRYSPSGEVAVEDLPFYAMAWGACAGQVWVVATTAELDVNVLLRLTGDAGFTEVWRAEATDQAPVSDVFCVGDVPHWIDGFDDNSLAVSSWTAQGGMQSRSGTGAVLPSGDWVVGGPVTVDGESAYVLVSDGGVREVDSRTGDFRVVATLADGAEAMAMGTAPGQLLAVGGSDADDSGDAALYRVDVSTHEVKKESLEGLDEAVRGSGEVLRSVTLLPSDR